MPLREYRLESGEIVEAIVDGCPDELVLDDGRVGRRVFSLPARTPARWGDTEQRPHYNRGLQRWVSGDREADAIAKARGFVSHRELGTESEVDSAYESYASRVRGQAEAENREQAEYQGNLQKFDGDANRAVETTWSLDRVRAGDTVYAQETP